MASRKRQKKSHLRRNVTIAAVGIALVLALALGLSQGQGGASISSTSSQDPLQISSLTPVRGSTNAPVTIFEFGDFQCNYCHQWFVNTEPQIIQNLVNTGQVKLVWKDFDYYGPDSTYASEAAYAAGEQGKFWQFYDALYSNQGAINSGWASPANLQKFAQSLGLNVTQFNQSFNSGKYTSLINSNFNEGKQLGVTGTPTFIIEGPSGQTVQLTGAQPYSAFQAAISSVGGG